MNFNQEQLKTFDSKRNSLKQTYENNIQKENAINKTIKLFKKS